MATALAAQLAQIAASTTNSLDLKAQKKAHSQSLLFDPRVAASQDFEAIYQICIEGYQELCQIDSRFSAFARGLFSKQSKREERTQTTAAQNKELDGVVESFLCLVGGKVLLKPALKAVEWLVRRFRIHEHNTICLILTFLPYHTMPIFPTVLSIIPRNLPPALKFLHPYVESLACPSRHTIVHTATNNRGFFSALNIYVLKVSRAGHHHRALLAFWAGVVTEAVAGMLDQAGSSRREAQRQKEEDVLLLTLPFLNEGLSMTKVPELRVGCYMILTVLASKARPEDQVLNAMMEAVVSYWTSGTTHAGLICLAVLAQHTRDAGLPRKVFKAVMSIDSIEDDLITLGRRYRVDKLTLGLILGVLEGLGKGQYTSQLKFVRLTIQARLMDTTYTSTAIKSVLLAADNTEAVAHHGSDVQGQLADLILRLSDSEVFGDVVQDIIKATNIDMDRLEMKLQTTLHHKEILSTIEVEDVEMEDAMQKPEESFEVLAQAIPIRTVNEVSFLSHSESYLFGSLCHAFLLASSSPTHLRTFSNFSVLRKPLAMTEPLCFSFFVRLWCGPYPAISRAAAIGCVCKYFEETELTADVQVLLPYVLYALEDPSLRVRRSVTDLILLLKSRYAKAEKDSIELGNMTIFGKDIYGTPDQVQDMTWISPIDTVKIIDDLLIPNLEECRLDATHIARVLVESLAASHTKNQKSPKKEFKTSFRVTIFTFLGTHVVNTPLYAVKSRLLSTLIQVEKVGNTSRSKVLLPIALAVEALDEKAIKGLCNKEQIDATKFVSHIVSIVSPTDRDGLRFLQRLIVPEESSSSWLLRLSAFQRIHDTWRSMKSDTQLVFSEVLLDLATRFSSTGTGDDVETQAMDTLRAVSLSTGILLSMLNKLPSLSTSSNDGPSTAKRRRISQHQVEGPNAVTLETVAGSVRKVTVVLELVQASKVGKAPELMKGLFQILADLQHSKIQTGTEMGYIQSLVLDSLCSIVEKTKNSTSSKPDSSAVRADLIVECVRSTSSPQVQYSALLLMSSLASVAPEVVIHSVMPIFTFMSSTVLRHTDDYSAHVVDKTIDTIIPPLVDTLRKSKGDPVAGASELLLSFVAAFEHIPMYRRQTLFQSLIDKLGPEDFLFAVLVMLMDKYNGNKTVTAFSQQLVSHYDPKTQLASIEKYIDLVVDTLNPKRTKSERLLSPEDGKVPEVIALNLLSLPPQLLLNRRLIMQVGKILSRPNGDIDAPAIRQSYSRMMEQVLSLIATATHQRILHTACQDILTALLGLLSMQEFIISLKTLLEQDDIEIRRQGLRSLEHRIDTDKSEDMAAQKACLSFLPRLTSILNQTPDTLLRHTAITCADRIIERYGKKDLDASTAVAKAIAGETCLGAADSKVGVIALLCLATSVEVLREAFIPIVPLALPKALDHLQSSIEDVPSNDALHNAVYSLVEAMFTYIPWMVTGEYLNRLLKISYESANAEMGFKCDQNRSDVLKLVAKQVKPRACFAALGRTWTNAMIEGPKAVEEHLQILSLIVDRQPKSEIAKQSNVLSDLLLKVFDLRRIQFSPRTDDSYEDEEVDQVEETVNQVAIKMIYKLNDSNFRPVFNKMLEWATTTHSTKDKKSRLYRQTTWYKFLHTFFDTLKSIVTSYASFIIDNTVFIFTTFSSSDPDSLALCNNAVLALDACFTHDQDEFWQIPAHFTSISTPLLSLLPNTSFLPSLVQALTSLAASISSPEQHKSLNSGILIHLRSDAPQTRLSAVRCQVSLMEKLGEEWLSLLPEMLPFIAEALEDGDEEVEAEVRAWVRGIEQILGESLDPMLQ